MSNWNQPPAGGNFQSNNPYQGQPQQPPPQGGTSQDYYSAPQGPPPGQQQQQQGAWQPPPGPPPPQYQQGGNPPPPGQPPRRTGTFEEANFVPDNERGEQREAIEQFEMNKSGPEDPRDRAVAQLTEEFPNLDSSLIAALYNDTQSVGATREMLLELAKTT